MSKDNLITGLDVGSTTIRVVVGQLVEPNNQLQIIGASEVVSNGISKGVVTSIEEATSSISSAIEKAERLCGFPVSSVWTGISSTQITAEVSRGVVAVSKSNGEISEEDVERAVEAARTVATPPNYEILHVIPRSFTIDNQEKIKDPVGMTGIRLEVEAQIIQSLSSQIKNFTKTIYRTGLDIDDLVLGILASSESTLTPRQKELGVVLVNIGGPTTSLVVFEEGDILTTKIIPIGSEHITSDIAIGLRTSLDIAESVKLEHGTVIVSDKDKRKDLNIGTTDEGKEEKVSKKYLAEIIEARVEEIFDKVDQELVKIDRSGMLPAGVVLTGAGAKLEGLTELAKKKLRLPASLGYPQEMITAIDKINDPSFATAIGLVKWGHELSQNKKGLFKSMGKKLKSVDQVVDKVKKWGKSLLP